MQYSVLSVLLLAALAAGASIPQPSSDSESASPKQKRGLLGSYYAPSAAVVAHAPAVYHAPVLAHAPVVAHAPAVYHAPLLAHAPAATSYSSISVTHSVPKLAIAHAPVYHAPAIAHAPVYAAHAPVYAAHAPVYAAHAPLLSHASAYYH